MLMDKYVVESSELLARLAELPILIRIKIFEHIQMELLFAYDNLAGEIEKEGKCVDVINVRNYNLPSSTKDRYTTSSQNNETVNEIWKTSIISIVNSACKIWSEKIPLRTKTNHKKPRNSNAVKSQGTKPECCREIDIFECAVCCSQFNTKNDLIKHVRKHKTRTFACSLCEKKFTTQTVLRNHVAVIHRKVDKFYCNKCQYFCYSTHTLKEHIRMKHERRFKKYACVICKAILPTRCMIKVHLRSHTGEKPYKCDSCNSSFACSGHLTNHKNAVHSEQSFTCDECFKSFQTIHRLKRHALIHSAIKPFNCPLCENYSSNTHGNLTRHIKTVHQMKDFSFSKYKKMMNGEPTEGDSDNWTKNAEPIIRKYLEELSTKVGYNVTIDDLKDKYAKSKNEDN